MAEGAADFFIKVARFDFVLFVLIFFFCIFFLEILTYVLPVTTWPK